MRMTFVERHAPDEGAEQIASERSPTDASLPSPLDACGVEISGAYGPFSDVVNGVFEPTSQQCCGVSVYRKRDDGDKWLEYSSNALKWNVLDTAHRGQSWGWAAFASRGGGIEKCVNVPGWKMYDGTKWEDRPSMRMTFVERHAPLINAQAVQLEQQQQQQHPEPHLPQLLLQQQHQHQRQQKQLNGPPLRKRTSVVMSSLLEHTRTASQVLSPHSSPKVSATPQPPPPQLASFELTSPTEAAAPIISPTLLKVHHETDGGVLTSHTIKYNPTSNAADVASYVVRKMQLLRAAYELVFRSLDSSGSDDVVYKCKDDTLLSDAVAACSGFRGKWWVRPYQLSYSEIKNENEWLRKALEDATERQNEAFERERAADARVEQISEYVADLEGELRRNQRSKEALQLWNKGKAGSLGGFVEKLANNGSHLQVICMSWFQWMHIVCAAIV